MKKSVLLLFFAGCVATGIFGIGRKIPMNRVNDLGQREGYYFCLGNTQRIICPAHGICLEMRENYVVPLIR